MLSLKSLAPTIAAALAVFAAASWVGRAVNAQSLPPMTMNGDVSRLPAAGNILVQSVPATDPNIQVSAGAATAAAMKEFTLGPSDIDTSLGVTRARVSISGSPNYQSISALVVVANVPQAGFLPSESCSKLNVVIDGRSGRYVFAYAADCTSR